MIVRRRPVDKALVMPGLFVCMWFRKYRKIKVSKVAVKVGVLWFTAVLMMVILKSAQSI